ncbi:hypothetical protein Ddye_001194 [Dipteronia dyeriana]|uniref:Reverse transcriptase n=1 Tax=Dipteronia dyeriana TaxID=168575 RepID=A0AAE0CT33_9ROSI|nr:hypothetical protein Ddye_001194 [Dipteronia dyeriana]
MNKFDLRSIKFLGGSVMSRGVAVDSFSASGGLLTLCNEEAFVVTDCIINDHCIIVASFLSQFKNEVIFCNVYAANQEDDRKALWLYILNGQSSLPRIWVIGGGFNMVLEHNKRLGGLESISSMRNFKNFIDMTGVVDLPLQKGLCRSLSDHNPILLGEAEKNWGPKPFRFLNSWLECKEMMGNVRDTWKNKKYEGSDSYALLQKSIEVKKVMRSWAKDNLGEIHISDRKLDGPIQIKEGVFGYFKNHFQSHSSLFFEMQRLDFNPISVSDRVDLERKFSTEEIWEALYDCDDNKAPGPDGFNLNFIRTNREVVKNDYFRIYGGISQQWLGDDTLLFVEPHMDFLLSAKRILRCFELVSCLKINFHKSSLVKIGKKSPSDYIWAKAFRCGNPLKESLWIPVIKKVKDRLAPWRRSLLFKKSRHFGNEHSSLWKTILCAKYGVNNEGIMWKFSQHAFPRILAFATYKEGLVSEYGNWVDNNWSWNIQLRRQPFSIGNYRNGTVSWWLSRTFLFVGVLRMLWGRSVQMVTFR